MDFEGRPGIMCGGPRGTTHQWQAHTDCGKSVAYLGQPYSSRCTICTLFTRRVANEYFQGVINDTNETPHE